MAVALHIDDSMSWGELSGLTKEKKFVEADSLADELLSLMAGTLP